MLTLVNQLKDTTQLRWHRVHKFKSKICFSLDLGPYRIKVAESYDEIVECFKLRNEVFNREFRGLEWTVLDFDKFDYHFDHLLIIHRDSNQVIGTYRLSCSTFSDKSYTELEFDLTNLKLKEGPFLELGRACIHKDFRKGTVISLLWRGIISYMNATGAKILFGCSSLKISNARDAALVYKLLQYEGFVSGEFLGWPTRKFKMDGLAHWLRLFKNGLNFEETRQAEALISPLLNSYLRMGAKIAAEPAFDRDFDCIDILTVMKKEDLDRTVANKLKLV